MAGCSETPLAVKLGFEPGDSVYVETTPDWYSKFANENKFELEAGLPATHAHMFFIWRSELEEFLKQNEINQIEKSFWVSWPKKAAKAHTDLTEQTFRDKILPLGWVDTKVAAIDDTWSGLKFLRRRR